jgi:hypothetical protein
MVLFMEISFLKNILLRYGIKKSRVNSFLKIFVVLSVGFLFLSGCGKKKSSKVSEPSIISIYIEKRRILNSPDFIVEKSKIKGWVSSVTSGAKTFSMALGKKKENFNQPYHLDLMWTIRPVEVIRPIRRKGEIHNRAFEISAEVTVRPLFTDSTSFMLRGVESVWKSFSGKNTRNLDEIMEKTLKKSIEKTLENVWFKGELRSSSPERILKLLKSDQVSIRILSVDIIGKRKLIKAVPKLILMLKMETKESFRMRIAGVLGILGDESAVEPLSDFALALSDEHTMAVLSVIASIGGSEANVFLQWMALGHQSSEVRKGASNLLEKADLKSGK